MKVLHISTLDHGGAAKACIRLHEGLLASNIDSNILFFDRTFNGVPKSYNFYKFYYNQENKRYHNTSYFIKLLNKIKYIFNIGDKAKFAQLQIQWNKLLNEKGSTFSVFSFPLSMYNIKEHPLYQDADIINLHWISGFLDYPSFFKINTKKVIWTLHDMNPFTGGCHYSNGCPGFQNTCIDCPQLQTTNNPNYTAEMLQLKKKALANTKDLTIVSPSLWMRETAEKSTLFKSFMHFHIPYGIDTSIFTK